MARKTQEKIYIYIYIYIHSYIQECVRSLKRFKTKHAVGLEKNREALLKLSVLRHQRAPLPAVGCGHTAESQPERHIPGAD